MLVLEPTVKELTTERDQLAASVPGGEDALRARAVDYRLTSNEARVLRRLDQIDFLLGDDE
jgi:hypothetical protein